MKAELLVTPGFKLTDSPKPMSAAENAVWVAKKLGELNDAMSQENVSKATAFELAAALIQNAMKDPMIDPRKKTSAIALIEEALGYNTVQDLTKMN